MPKNDVDAYISRSPKACQLRLQELRAIIKNAAPNAVEKISYGMPYYEYKGRLAYFRLAKTYVGLYIPTPILERHRSLVDKYYSSKATLHFALDQKIPIQLVKKLIRARAQYNRANVR